MPDQPNTPHDPSLEAALEKTAGGRDFSAEGLKRELEETRTDAGLEQTPAQFLQKTATDATRSTTAERTATVTSFEESSRIPGELSTGEGPGGSRFEVDVQVGSGATSRVYAVRDKSLGRTIAVKFLRKAGERKTSVRRRFLHEARVTAMLEHPNIMPVHDIGVTARGEVYFTMKNITGITLGDAIRTATKGQAVPGDFGSIDGRVRMFLKVCDALTYAHHRGFVHQDVKPDNIMLGEFGEVLLLDWGSALAGASEESAEQDKGLYGTPAYMSPEQARRERSDERSDIYCLGSTFFHALFLRHPTWADDPELFWEKKRRGVIDPLSETVRRAVPAALLSITLKALAADRTQRYQSVAEFAMELKRWQAGQAVRAHRENPWERFSRWYRRNRRLFWVSTAATVLVLGAGGVLFREKIKELITWKLIYAEDFSRVSTTALGKDWQAYKSTNWRDILPDSLSESGAWCVKNGALEALALNPLQNLAFRQAVPGDLRAEWDVTPLASSINLNSYIGGETRFDGYTFHIGGFGYPASVTLSKGKNVLILDRLPLRRECVVGRTYRMRIEREGKHVRLFVDGDRIVDYQDLDMPSGPGHQTFGLEACSGAPLRLDNILVYHHPLPLKVSPLATPDLFAERGHWQEALGLYQALGRAYPGTEVSREAMYKAARCQLQLDSLEPARLAFLDFERQCPRHELVPLARYERSRIEERLGRLDSVDAIYRGLAQGYAGHALLRVILREMSEKAADSLTALRPSIGADSAGDRPIFEWLERTRLRIYGWGHAFRTPLTPNAFLDGAVSVLSSDCGWAVDSVAARFGDQRNAVAHEIADRGDLARLAPAYRDQPTERMRALATASNWERILREFPGNRATCARALDSLGRFENLLRDYPEQRSTCAWATVALGRFDEVLREYPEQRDACAEALLRSGRMRECVDRYPDQVGQAQVAAAALGELPRYVRRVRYNPEAVADMLLGRVRDNAAAWALLAQRGPSVSIRYSFMITDALVNLGRPQEAPAAMRYMRLAAQSALLLTLGEPAQARALYPYCEFAAAGAWREQGLEDSTLLELGDRPLDCSAALRRMGRGAEVLQRFPLLRLDCALALVELGRYDEALRHYPDQREACAQALLALGRYDELLQHYADRRPLACEALLRLGRFDEALQRFPEQRERLANNLLRAERYADLAAGYADVPLPYSLALVALGRAAELPINRGDCRLSPAERLDVTLVFALRERAAGRRQRADSLLAAGRTALFYYASDAWYQQRFGRFLLAPVLKALQGDRAALPQALREVAAAHRYQFGQLLYYDAGRLAGTLSDSQYLAQPYALGAAARLLFVKAIEDDVAGRGDAALEGYRAWLATAPPIIEASNTQREFAKWRVNVLARRTSAGVDKPRP